MSPLITTYEVVSVDKLKFPTIEICPSSAVSYRKAFAREIHPVYVQQALKLKPPDGRGLVRDFIKKILPPDSPLRLSDFGGIVYDGNNYLGWFQVVMVSWVFCPRFIPLPNVECSVGQIEIVLWSVKKSWRNGGNHDICWLPNYVHSGGDLHFMLLPSQWRSKDWTTPATLSKGTTSNR